MELDSKRKAGPAASVLDGKKAHATSISLRSARMEPMQLKLALLDMNVTKLSGPVIGTLVSQAPDATEVSAAAIAGARP